MFPACCFCQRTYVAQGLLMGYSIRLELTLASIYIYIYICIYVYIHKGC